MSVTVSRTEGVTVFTLTSDPDSHWPPLCQILKSLCYSPMCCSMSQRLRNIQGTSLSALGALQILIGLLHIGLGNILYFSYTIPWFLESGFPFWMGSLFIVFGILCILSERFPSPCLVTLNAIFNLAGAAFAIAAIVLYTLYLTNLYVWLSCDNRDYWSYRETTPSPDPYTNIACMEGKGLIKMLLRSIAGVLIVLSAVELSVTISSAVLGIKALIRSSKEKHQTSDDPELHKPLLEEVTSDPAA